MSVHVSSCVWKHAKAKGNQLLVLLALADTAQDDGTCWPGHDFTAAKTRLSARTVIRCVDALVEAGALSKEERPGTSNLYTIAVCEGCQVVTPGGDKRGRRGDSRVMGGVTPVSPEPSMNHQEEPSGGAPRSKRKPETSLPADWKPKGKHVELATKWGLDLSSEAFRFRAHAEANDRRMRDWDAAFAMWLSKAREHARKNGAAPKRRGNVPEGW